MLKRLLSHDLPRNRWLALMLVVIVLIIGGLGSTTGALVGALLVGLMANYTGFLVPKMALFSNILLMMAILLWRPQGVYALNK